MENIGKAVGIGKGTPKIYATIDLEKSRVGRTKLIENEPNSPRWYESFHIYSLMLNCEDHANLVKGGGSVCTHMAHNLRKTMKLPATGHEKSKGPSTGKIIYNQKRIHWICLVPSFLGNGVIIRLKLGWTLVMTKCSWIPKM
ncbi:hypothetical protein ABFS82_04G227000 [Erythranthe guttata]